MKSCQVGVKAILRFKVNVESHKVQEREMKVFGRGIIHVSDEGVWVFGLHRPVQALEVPFNSSAAQPPNNRCCDFIPERIAQESWMASARTSLGTYQFFNVR